MVNPTQRIQFPVKVLTTHPVQFVQPAKSGPGQKLGKMMRNLITTGMAHVDPESGLISLNNSDRAFASLVMDGLKLLPMGDYVALAYKSATAKKFAAFIGKKDSDILYFSPCLVSFSSEARLDDFMPFIKGFTPFTTSHQTALETGMTHPWWMASDRMLMRNDPALEQLLTITVGMLLEHKVVSKGKIGLMITPCSIMNGLATWRQRMLDVTIFPGNLQESPTATWKPYLETITRFMKSDAFPLTPLHFLVQQNNGALFPTDHAVTLPLSAHETMEARTAWASCQSV